MIEFQRNPHSARCVVGVLAKGVSPGFFMGYEQANPINPSNHPSEKVNFNTTPYTPSSTGFCNSKCYRIVMMPRGRCVCLYRHQLQLIRFRMRLLMLERRRNTHWRGVPRDGGPLNLETWEYDNSEGWRSYFR
jgi:hypothetical protein